MWLTYWMVFGTFNVIEMFFGFVLYFVPFYDWLRAGFFLWLALPQTRGAEIVYERVVRAILVKHKDEIRAFIAQLKKKSEAVFDDAKAAASDPNNLMKAAGAAAQLQQAVAESAQVDPAEVEVEITEAKNADE